MSTNPFVASYPYRNQIQETVDRFFQDFDPSQNVSEIPLHHREAFVTACSLRTKLASQQHCQRCWVSPCFCDKIPPLRQEKVNDILGPIRRLYLLLHPREVFMGVDTAKLILSTFQESNKLQLVIAGIPAPYQESMQDLEKALQEKRVYVLFPDEKATTMEEIQRKQQVTSYDLVVIDGTWQQARRMKSKYFPTKGPAQTVQLSSDSVSQLDQEKSGETEDDDGRFAPGHQLRKHIIPWKRIATFEALRLYLAEGCSEEETDVLRIRDYVSLSNQAFLANKTW